MVLCGLDAATVGLPTCPTFYATFCLQELLRTEGLLTVPLTVYHNERVLEQRIYEAMPSWGVKAPEELKAAEADAGDKDFSKRDGETTQDYIKREYSALKPFVIISLSYLLFTTTDGAIRMIVLLHAYNSGFTAWEVAIMFTLYELAGERSMHTMPPDAASQHEAASCTFAEHSQTCCFAPSPRTSTYQHVPACTIPPRSASSKHHT